MIRFHNPLAEKLAGLLSNVTCAKVAKIQDMPRLHPRLTANGVAETILDVVKALEDNAPPSAAPAEGAPPTKLNGWPVIGTARKPGYAVSANTLVVMVKRGDSDYVVATWSPPLKTEWVYGHYCPSFAEACATFAAQLPHGEPEKE